VQLIHPERRTVTPEQLVTGLRLDELAPPERPYLGLNMVASLDGKATLDWRTKGLSSDVDRRVFHLLRTQADAVMVGAGTVRTERYGRITKSDELRQIRVNDGLVPDALAVVVSGRLDLAADLPLLNEPDQKVVIATASEDTIAGVKGAVEYARVGDDLPRLMVYLWERHAVRSVLCEGGPTLNSFLFAANLVDELFLTMTPKLVGGAAALTIVAGRELVEPLEPSVVSVAEADGELYTRWRFRASGAR
jgi:riboflavin-specific deaminase-like protein